MVWKMESTGMMMPESQRGTRESRIPHTSPTEKPIATEINT